MITDEKVTSEGSGILNYLFYAKNQPKTSKEQAIYSSISEAFNLISSGYNFDIPMAKSNTLILRFSYKNQSWIDARSVGWVFKNY